MNRAQLFLITFLCAFSYGRLIGAVKVEDGHRETHDEKDFSHKITKRYALARVPLSYTRNQLGEDDNLRLEKRYRSLANNPAASHFRELQVRQTRRLPNENSISPAQIQSYRNLLQYYGSDNNNGLNTNDIEPEAIDSGVPSLVSSQLARGSDDGTPLTDRDLKELLLLLEGYQMPASKSSATSSRNFYTPPAQYFTQEMMDDVNPMMGKRETGKRTMSRTQLGQEQPMSFDNSLADNYPVFLNQKRSKRIGAPPLKKRSSSMTSVRIKKETSPEVEASLDKIFDDTEQHEPHEESHQHQQHSTSIPTTAISSSDQIPSPASGLQRNKPKKAIDWSNHFGIDKRQEKQPIEHESPSTASVRESDVINDESDMKTQNNNKIASKSGADIFTSPRVGNTASSTSYSAQTVGKPEKVKKEKKDTSRKENDTEEKDDRKWILKEFYKNLAMSTNNKRKRESPTDQSNDELGKLEKMEKKMEEAGDQIIWDALKYTGAHRDVGLSPEELAHVKTEIIQKLAAAYSLEKIREAIEDFRQELAQLKDKQRHY